MVKQYILIRVVSYLSNYAKSNNLLTYIYILVLTIMEHSLRKAIMDVNNIHENDIYIEYDTFDDESIIIRGEKIKKTTK